MKKTAIAALLTFLVPLTATAFDEAAELEKARTATAAFAGALKSELISAMQAGGALSAIEVCNTRAGDIASKISMEQGMYLSRVSLKNRNPGNAPKHWQKPVLESFDIRHAKGTDPAMLTWHEVAETEQGREFRFMKAIPTGGLCLQCHGPAVAPEVAEKLSALYPEDKATGYLAGEIRGAFVVTRELDR